MAKQLETFADIYKRVAENVGLQTTNTQHQLLAQGWVNRAYLDFNGKFSWPWLRDRFSVNTILNDTVGTVNVTKGSRTITGTGTAFATAQEGQVFLIRPREDRLYIIKKVNSANELLLEQPYNEATATGQSYIIWHKYYTLASEVNNFEDFYIEELKLFWSHIKEWDDKAKAASVTGDIRMWSIWGYDYTTRSDSTGTVSITKDARTVTGVSTLFITNNVQPGDKITFNGTESYHIRSIDSETQLTIVELATTTRSGVAYTVVSEQAPTVVFDAINQTRSQVISYTYKRKTYPMQNDNEVPNLDRQFWDILVIGGMLYGYEFLGDDRQTIQQQLFDKAIRESWAFFDTDERPEAMEWSVEAGRTTAFGLRHNRVF